MDVLFVTSEYAGLAKVGGLGDVSASLPAALAQRGHDVRVLLPGYSSVLAAHPAVEVVASLPPVAGLPAASLGLLRSGGAPPIYVVICPDLYDRDGSAYADAGATPWPDNDVRFARLSLAAAEIADGLAGLDWRPEVVHANDWPTGLVPAYLAWRGSPAASLFTVHNLAHQGLFAADRLQPLAIPASAMHIEGLEFHGQLSFLKAGLYFSDQATTVSPTYAREITAEPHGCGLSGLLAGLAEECRLTGILNGIDDWPSGDGSSCDEAATAAPARPATARLVRTGLCLAPSSGPLFGFVARLDRQKGIDVLAEGAGRIVARGGQIAILGTGAPELERRVIDLTKSFRGAVGALIGYADPLARRILAASDFFLMPSLFEPCGLTQMYAQRCGTLPIAHATGGLIDTITDGRTGFLFPEPSARSMGNAVDRAFEAYAEESRLDAMRRQAAEQSFTWAGSAARYVEAYQRSISRGLDSPPTRKAA